MDLEKASKNIIVVVRQAATANAFIPVLKKALEAGICPCLFAFESGFKILSMDFPAVRLIKDVQCTLSELDETKNPSLLLTGTSEYAGEDNYFWRWARRKKIPSIAYVDSWTYYWQRFSSQTAGKEKFDLMPDFVAVIDELMRSRMKEYGCDEKKLIVTGNPVFDVINDFRQKEVPEIKELVKKKLGSQYIMFVGEPFNGKVFDGKEKESLGYTESEVLGMVIDAFEAFGRKTGVKYTLAYKSHPRAAVSLEVKSLVESYSANNFVSLVVSELPSYDLVANSKMVIGMTSQLLHEAMLMGANVLSIQPGKKRVNDVVDGFSGIKLLISPTDIYEGIIEMFNMCAKAPARESSLINSTDRFLQFLKICSN